MKKYKISDLQKIFEYANIPVIHIEGTKFLIVNKNMIKRQGKTSNHATEVELDLFVSWQNVIWLIEFTDSENYDTKDFDNFCAKIELLSQNNNQKLTEAINKIWQKYSPGISKPTNGNLKLLGLYVTPHLNEVKEGTLRQRIPIRSKNIFLWGRDTFEYFRIISSTIRMYSKYELFDYFSLSLGDVFKGTELEGRRGFSPHPVIKIRKGVFGCKMFVFKIEPRLLLERTYVLRNEGWRGNSFQRMILIGKLAKIRNYIIENKDASFANNIIVSLDPNISSDAVETKKGEINLPFSFGSLCIIDGQHRLLAFTQDFYSETNPKERTRDAIIKKMADEEEIVITLLIFNGSAREVLKKQTKLFRDINANQTKVKSDFIYNLEEIINIRSPESIGNKVLKHLSKRENGVFQDKFETKWYQTGRIKRSSIVKWGLLELVDAKNQFFFRETPKKIKKQFQKDDVDDYVVYCGDYIESYFRAIKTVFQNKYKRKSKNVWNFWRKSGLMLLSTSSIVGFLRLYRHFLRSKIIKERDIVKYIKEVKGVNFERDKYEFTSSQWARLEQVMFDDIRKKYPKFGDESLIKRS